MLLFKNNIQDIMGWNDQKFELFLLNWTRTHEIHITSQRSAFIYSKAYFDFLLPLFFTICQIDLNLKTKVVDKQVVLLTLLSFYLVNDVSLSKQSPSSLVILKVFLNSLKDLGLITETAVTKTNILLTTFSVQDEEVVSDLVSSIDIELVRDLLISSNPVLVSKHHAMFYYEEPSKATFLVKKPYPTPVEFFDEMFRLSQTIADRFLRDLYSHRLHKLMEAQYKKSIFPF